MMSRISFLLLLLPMMMFGRAQTAKILLHVINVNSQILVYARFGESLGNLGHRVVLLAPSNANIPKHLENENFTITVYSVPEKIPYASTKRMSENLVNVAFSTTLLGQLIAMVSISDGFLTAFESDCKQLFENEKIMKELDEFRFEFAIVDPFAGHCTYLLPFKMNIPYASFSINWFSWFYRVPRLSSFSSMVGYSDEMTFYERTMSFVYEIIDTALFQVSTTEMAEKYMPEKKLHDPMQLVSNSSLWFYLEDTVLGFPKPLMPNTVAIGDITARPAKPLPAGLNEFVEKSKNGVILVSFGSYFEYIPEFVVHKLCDTFRNTTYDYLWKFKMPELCENVPNVRILPWIPQNDLLAHENVKLFITHGGFNSITESINHGKPMIIMPIAFDQYGNAAAMYSKGSAIRMNVAAFTSEELWANIERVMMDKSFSQNAKHLSVMLKDKSESPAERASNMIEHVLKYGDKHLRTGAFNLTIFQYLMFDIFGFLFAIFIFLLILTACIVRFLYNASKKWFVTEKKTKLA